MPGCVPITGLAHHCKDHPWDAETYPSCSVDISTDPQNALLDTNSLVQRWVMVEDRLFHNG